MSAADPHLSICIATRNRAALLRETLDSIAAQVTDEVEVVIVDGASTDETQAVVRQSQARLPRLRYCQLQVNGGVDRDYSRAIELARGEYCWFMTDDDLLKPNAIATVLRHLNQGYSLIVLNAENRTLDQSEVIHARRLGVFADRVYQPHESEALFEDVGYHLTYIGAVVIRREVWNARDKERFWGTWFVHFGVIFQQPLPAPTLVLADPVIMGRIGNISWTERIFEIWMFRWPELVWAMPFSDKAKSKITPPAPWRNFKALLVHRGDGSYTLLSYRQRIAPRAAPGWYKRLAQFIAVLPPCAVWLVVYLYFRVAKPQARTLHYDWLHTATARQCFGWLARTRSHGVAP